MKKIKICIIFMIMLILVILITLLYINKEIIGNEIAENNLEDVNNYINNTVNDISNTQISNVNNLEVTQTDGENRMKKIQGISEYLIVKKCLDKYVMEADINGIGRLAEKTENYFLVPITIEKKVEGIDVKTYAIYGIIGTQEYKPVSEAYLILNVHEQNRTFSVEMLSTKEELLNTEYKEVKEIPIQDNNVYTLAKNTDENVMLAYALNLKRLALAYPDIFYNNVLDSEYKEKRFPTIDTFRKYVNENKNTLKEIDIKKYRLISRDSGDIYVVADQYDNVYVFKQHNDIWNYTVYLDNYTIMLDEYAEDYNELDKFDKAKYNLTKFINMVDTKDYNAIYNVLDSTFRENNFKTKEELTQYIKNNMYDLNSIQIEDYNDNEYGYNTFTITLSNSRDENENKEMFIIINQTNGIDFTMSFSFE